MDIVFVTGNVGKVETAKKYFCDSDINLEWYKYDAIEANINDIEFIAKEKVLGGYEMVKKPCVTLDAGFYINNFPNNPGFPGAFTKRELLDKMGLDGLLEIMKDVKDRSCYFMECLTYYDGAEIKYFYGLSKGSLATTIRGIDRSKKWSSLWYVFIPQNHIFTLAEMDDEERNNRVDGHTSALHEFSNWYKKEKQLIKR
jgi:XTP/dITP diphosphohydrolase